jgi:crossover junction endodeoxyribonuclease RuvC
MVAAADAGVECAEYAPARVKQTVCGYGRAEGAGQRMVMAILGLKQPPTPHHAADALAVAICHARRRCSRLPRQDRPVLRLT